MHCGARLRPSLYFVNWWVDSSGYAYCADGSGPHEALLEDLDPAGMVEALRLIENETQG